MKTEAQLHRSLVKPRPPIVVDVYRCHRCAWSLFAPHHYLNTGPLPNSAQTYLATWNGLPVAFCSVMPMLAKLNFRRISRVVVLPDHQGLGIGTALAEAIAELWCARGNRMGITTSHPAMIVYLERSPRWQLRSVMPFGNRASGMLLESVKAAHSASFGRVTVSFEYVSGCDSGCDKTPATASAGANATVFKRMRQRTRSR